ELSEAEDRTVFANVFWTKVAATALANAAFHAFFERSEDRFGGETELDECGQGEFGHNWRTANNCHAVNWGRADLSDHIGHIANVVKPILFRNVNGLMNFHVIALMPGGNILLVHAKSRGARAVNDGEF